MIRAMIGVSVLLVVAGCQTTQTEELTLEEAAKEECRMIEVPGSILKDKVCTNKATWKAREELEREKAQETLRETRDGQGGLQTGGTFGG